MKYLKTFEEFVDKKSTEHVDEALDQNKIDDNFIKSSAAEKFQMGLMAVIVNGAADEMDADEFKDLVKNSLIDKFGDEIKYSSPVTKEKILANLKKHVGFSSKVVKAFSDVYKELEEVEESKVNESSNDLKEKYDDLIKALEKAKVPCRVKLSKDSITIELGFNYPDRLADKAFDACEAAGIDSNKCNICAEESGGHVLDSKRVMGGPKRH